jgi:peptidoglycan/xylan/chitin deacetylase (PgdA/CDA1 family)
MRSKPVRAAAELRPSRKPIVIVCPRVLEHAGLTNSCITSSQLERNLDELLAAKRRFLDLDQFRAAMEGLSEAPDGLLLSFDYDGVDFLDSTLPILRERNIPSVLFLAIGKIGRVTNRGFGPLRQQTRHLSWSQLRSSMRAGVRVQSAGFESLGLQRLAPEVEFGDLIRSRRELERRLQEEAVALRYPGAIADERMADLARRAGFSLAFGAVKDGSVDPLFAIRRISLRRGDSAESILRRTHDAGLGAKLKRASAIFGL